MAKKDKKQVKKEETKVSDKVKKEVKKETKEEFSTYTVTATLIEAPGCDECKLLRAYKEKEDAYEDLLKKYKALIKTQDGYINYQRRLIERYSVTLEYFAKCLAWAEDHLGFFARRKYAKAFSSGTLIDFLMHASIKNFAEGNTIEAEVDKELLQEILEDKK